MLGAGVHGAGCAPPQNHAPALGAGRRFVHYILSRLEMLRANGVEAIMIFDGGKLPMKGDEEDTRRKSVPCLTASLTAGAPPRASRPPAPQPGRRRLSVHPGVQWHACLA